MHALYNEALTYYEPLHEGNDDVDVSYFCDMAFCYWKTGLRSKAEDCYQTAVESGDTTVNLQSNLAEMCKEIGFSERSTKLLESLSSATTAGLERAESVSVPEQDEGVSKSGPTSSSMLAQREKRQFSKPSALERQRREHEQEQLEQERDGRIAGQFLRLQQSNASSREGEVESRLKWMSAAQILIQDFRSNSIFYPTERYMKFFGYTSEARAMSNASKAAQAALSGDPLWLDGLGVRHCKLYYISGILARTDEA